jgi:hypothetical protein
VRITRAFFVILGAALVSCSDNTTEPTVGASGSLSFSYTGAGATSATQYSASGAIPSNFGVNNGSSSWAAGFTDASNTQTGVYAFVPKGGNTWDETIILINRTTVGSSTIENCTAENCTEIAVLFGVNQNETNFTYTCTLTSGTVNITAISSTNVTGTFSGSGTCFLAGATGTTPFTVTGGSFNVGLTALLD